jgi:hypothetical protein
MRARTAVVAGLSTAILLVAPAASFAYGPGGGGTVIPPGFGPTITACSAGPGACTLHAESTRCHLRVTVPRGTFAKKTDIVISRISNASANTHLNTAKRHSVCAFGVGVFRNGARVHVASGKPPIQLNFTGGTIKSSDHLRILVPSGGSKAKNATFSAGAATSTLLSTHELAIVRHSS